MYVLDAETQLSAIDPHTFNTQVSEVYWNYTGASGGWACAAAIEAVTSIETFRGDIISFNTVFLAALKEGEAVLRAHLQAARTKIDFWRVEIFQNDALCVAVDIVAGMRRETSLGYQLSPPEVAAPEGVEPLEASQLTPRWFAQYDTRLVEGALLRFNEAVANTVWVRERDCRPIDAKGLAIVADTPMPRTFFAGGDLRMGSSISLSVYYYGDRDDMAAAGGGFLLVRASGANVRKGAYDQRVEIWSRAGALLAISNQIAFFR